VRCYTLQNISECPKITGVYGIHFQNSKSNKYYIGSSGRIAEKSGHYGIKTRWNSHFKLLKDNKHYSKKLQHAYNKYGGDNMIFTIMEECAPVDCLIREDFFITKYDSCSNGYNTKPLATSCLGHKVDPEVTERTNITKRLRRIPYEASVLELYAKNKNVYLTSKLLGISHKMTFTILKDYNIFPKNGDYRKKTVYVYTMKGEFIGEWSSAKECGKALDITSICSISHVASKRIISHRGMWFSYKKLSCAEAVNEILERIQRPRNRNKISRDDTGAKVIYERYISPTSET
jgi:hypothetical protein